MEIEYLNLWRHCLAEMGIGFFSYEGRGIRTGSSPPRYTDIDRVIFNTSTLENKVREALTFMFTEGVFMQHCGHWDADNDGVITREEFETDPKGIRRLIPDVTFDMFDADGDGLYSMQDRKAIMQPFVDAVASANMDIIYAILKQTASVALSDGWVEDHFDHPAIWTYLEQLDIPVGIFHGECDPATPVAGARGLEAKAKMAGKQNLHFESFPHCDHDLGALDYFHTGVPAKPIQSICSYIKSQTLVEDEHAGCLPEP